MVCPSCGANIPDGTKFCTSCGKSIYAAQNTTNLNGGESSFETQSPFVDSGEHVVATLSNGFTQNIISGEGFIKEDAFVTNKRVYYNSRHGIINVTKIRNVIDIPEVTGTKLMDVSHWGIIIAAIILAIVGIIISVSASAAGGAMFFAYAVILFAVFFITKKKHLRIEYAGGYISFSVRKYSMKNVQDFQKAIYAEKDKLRGTK